ncbi:MAG: alpha/beta hydrolase [Deltaproteobacteria bacterium]|nr:alpha/beta hydrolase [Deltaproteobacteria bacterium]
MKNGLLLWILLSLVVFACAEEEGSNENGDENGNEQVSFLPMKEGKIQSCTEGIDIAYQVWRYDGTAEATLLYINGRTEYTDKYHHLVTMFNKPYDIIMYDHFGQGRSGGTRAHADDFDAQHVCDLKRIVDELASESLPIAMVAHSMGGFVATRFAELYPDAARVYALSSPMYGIPVPDGMTVEDVKNMASSMVTNGNGEASIAGDTSAEIPTCEENNLTHDCEMYDKFKDDPIMQIGEPTWGWVNAAIQGFESLFADVGKIDKPFLIMQAGQEEIVIPEKHQEFCALLGEELCTIKVFENDYHELFFETDRDSVVQATVEFIEQQLAGD